METAKFDKKVSATQVKNEIAKSAPAKELPAKELMEEVKEKKPRAIPVSFKDKVNVLKLVTEGKGTVESLIEAGVEKRVATVALKTLLKEKLIKSSYVVA